MTPLFLLVTMSTFFYFTSVGALQPTLPRFVEGPLRGGSVAVGVAVGAFSLSAVLVRPIAGHLSDVYGRRLLIVLGSAAVATAIVGQLLVSELIWLLPLRLVAGVGEAFFFGAAAGVVNDLAPDERRGEAVSYFSLALYGGLVVGPILGETVLSTDAYYRAWWLAAALAAAASLLGIPVPETRPDDGGPPTRGWKRFMHPAALLPGSVLTTSMLGLGGFVSFVPLYALDLGMSGSKLVFALFSGVVMVVRSLGARIPDRLGPLRSARAALTGQSTGLLIAALWPTPTGLYTGTVVYALGQALSFPALMTIAVSGASPAERGAVVGTFTAFFDLAFGLGAVALGAVVAWVGYPGSFVAGALVALAGLVLTTLRRSSLSPG